jgi:hypothetical protein
MILITPFCSKTKSLSLSPGGWQIYTGLVYPSAKLIDESLGSPGNKNCMKKMNEIYFMVKV